MASIAITPASGSITAKKTVCRVNVTDASLNNAELYDNTAYPSEPALSYYLTFEVGGATVGKSYVFSPSPDGDHEFNNYIFPEAGTYTVRLSNAGTDGSVTTATVVVA